MSYIVGQERCGACGAASLFVRDLACNNEAHWADIDVCGVCGAETLTEPVAWFPLEEVWPEVLALVSFDRESRNLKLPGIGFRRH